MDDQSAFQLVSSELKSVFQKEFEVTINNEENEIVIKDQASIRPTVVEEIKTLIEELAKVHNFINETDFPIDTSQANIIIKYIG